jgi:hypothetical protein
MIAGVKSSGSSFLASVQVSVMESRHSEDTPDFPDGTQEILEEEYQ